MAKIRRLQSKMNSGQLDVNASLRSDIEQYYDGGEIVENVDMLVLGGVTRRGGLKYIAQVHNNLPARTVEFQFNLEQRYNFIFTNGRVDIYTVPEDAFVATLTSSPISNITTAMLPDLKWAQEADTLILFHPDLEPIEITRTGATTFTASLYAFTNIPTHAFGAVTVTSPAATLTPNAVTGSVEVTASASVFLLAHEGQYIKVNDGLIYITNYVSGTVLEGYVQTELKNTNDAASGAWELETGYEPVFSASRGWVRSGTFHESRLWLGGLKSRPQTVLATKIGEFANLDEGSFRDSDAINATISTAQLNAIYSIVSGRTLQVFTSGGEFSVPKSDLLEPITPRNISFLQQTNHGSANVTPVSVDGSTIFYDGKDFRDFIYNDVERSYIAPSLNLLSSDVINSVSDIALRRSTSASNASYVYAVNADGTVAVLHSLRNQNITAWAKWTTNGLFKDVCANGDDVYFIVEYEINGSAVRYYCKVDASLKLDCGKKATSGSPTTSWSGFTHLGNETVQAFGDDFVIPDIDLTSGAGTTDEAHLEVELGFAFFCRVKSMPFAGVFYGEDVTTRWKRAVKAWLRLQNTRNILVNGYRPALTNMIDAMDQAPALFSGFVDVALGGYDMYAQIDITQDEPTEFTLLGFEVQAGIGVNPR